METFIKGEEGKRFITKAHGRYFPNGKGGRPHRAVMFIMHTGTPPAQTNRFGQPIRRDESTHTSDSTHHAPTDKCSTSLSFSEALAVRNVTCQSSTPTAIANAPTPWMNDARKSAHLLVSVLLMDVASFDVTADDDQLNVLPTFARARAHSPSSRRRSACTSCGRR